MVGLDGSTMLADQALVAALWFALAVLLLDRFDIGLPRGDSIGVGGALVAGGLLVSEPEYVIPISVAMLVLAHIGHWRAERERLVAAVFTRLAAALMTAGMLWLLAALDPAGHTVLRLFVGSVGYLVFEVAVSQLVLSTRTSRSFRRLLSGNFRRHAPLIAAQASASMLVAITYPHMGAWSLVLVVVLLLLIRQSVASLLEIRDTYRATIEVLVEAAEGQDRRLAGHAERTAHYARTIGDRLGMSAVEIERISYAALLHDLGALSADSAGSAGAASVVLEETEFFSDVVPLLRVCDGLTELVEAGERELMAAFVVVLSSDIDVLENDELRQVHAPGDFRRLSSSLSPHLKARVVAAALELGYRIPAVA